MATGAQRKTSHPVMRGIMIALNIAFYGSALAGGIKLLHDLPQQSAPAVTAPAPQSAPQQNAPLNTSPALPSLPSSAPQTVPGDTPPTVSSPASLDSSPVAEQLPQAQYVTIQALDGTRADHMSFGQSQW